VGNRLQFLKKAWPLLVAPGIFLILFALYAQARGPFYLAFNYDPDYAYLFNGLNLQSGIAPEHVDHPGIPLQLFAAACIKITTLGSLNHATIVTVLAHAESYLKGMNSALMICYSISLLLFGVLVWRKTESMTAALLLQATPFLLAEDFYETARFRPESMILIVVLAMAAVLYVHVLRDDRKLGGGGLCLLSFLAATGVVTKINFLPLVLVPLFGLRTWKGRIGYVALTCIFVGLWLLPLKPHFPRFASWVIGLVTHQERYGIGEAGLLPAHYLMFLARLIVARPLFFLTLGTSVAALVYAWGWRRDKNDPQETRLVRLLTGLVLAQFLQYLMVGKFEQARYMVPAIVFCGLNWALLLALIRRWPISSVNGRPLRWASLSLGIFITGWLGSKLHHRYIQMAESRDVHLEMAKVLEKEFADKTVVYSFGCSSLYHALWFGNTYCGRRYGKTIIEDLFPNHAPAYMVEVLPQKTFWYSVAGPDILLSDRLARGEVVFVAAREWPEHLGGEVFNFLPKNVSLEKLRRQGEEAIYRVKALPNQ
jgi:hypothetical protein